MNTWSSALVSAFLVLAAVGLMLSHLHTWRRFRAQDLAPEDLQYRWRQFRRRMQTSAMVGVLAVALLIGQWITEPAWLVLAYWAGVLLVLCWVGLLALVDLWASKYYYGRMRDKFLVEQAKLQAELRRLKSLRGNGKAEGRK